MKKCICFVLAVLLVFSLCACAQQDQMQIEAPPQTDPPADPPTEPPTEPSTEPATEPPAVDQTVYSVCPNPAIASLLDAINKALAQAGHPIRLLHPESMEIQDTLEIAFTGDREDLYTPYMTVTLHQWGDVLGVDTDFPRAEGFYCTISQLPSQEAIDAGWIIFATALPFYESAFEEPYADSFAKLTSYVKSENVPMALSVYNQYGASAGQIFSVREKYTSTTTSQTVNGLEVCREERDSESLHEIRYSIVRDKEQIPTMATPSVEAYLAELGKIYSVSWENEIQEFVDGEYVLGGDAMVSSRSYGDFRVYIAALQVDRGIFAVRANCNADVSAGKREFYKKLCENAITLCGTDFTPEQIQEICNTLLTLEPKTEADSKGNNATQVIFTSPNGTAQVTAQRVENTFSCQIFMQKSPAEPLDNLYADKQMLDRGPVEDGRFTLLDEAEGKQPEQLTNLLDCYFYRNTNPSLEGIPQYTSYSFEYLAAEEQTSPEEVKLLVKPYIKRSLDQEQYSLRLIYDENPHFQMHYQDTPDRIEMWETNNRADGYTCIQLEEGYYPQGCTPQNIVHLPTALSLLCDSGMTRQTAMALFSHGMKPTWVTGTAQYTLWRTDEVAHILVYNPRTGDNLYIAMTAADFEQTYGGSLVDFAKTMEN